MVGGIGDRATGRRRRAQRRRAAQDAVVDEHRGASARRTAGCPRRLGDPRPRRRRGSVRAAEQAADQRRGLVVGQRRQRRARRVPPWPPSSRADVEQLRTRLADAAAPARRGCSRRGSRAGRGTSALAPVDVVEDDDQRAGGREALEQACAPPRTSRWMPPDRSPRPEQRRRVASPTSASSTASPLVRGEELADLLRASVSRVALRGCRSPPEHGGDRPERDAVAVGQAAAVQHRGVAARAATASRHQARLADAGRHRSP